MIKHAPYIIFIWAKEIKSYINYTQSPIWVCDLPCINLELIWRQHIAPNTIVVLNPFSHISYCGDAVSKWTCDLTIRTWVRIPPTVKFVLVTIYNTLHFLFISLAYMSWILSKMYTTTVFSSWLTYTFLIQSLQESLARNLTILQQVDELLEDRVPLWYLSDYNMPKTSLETSELGTRRSILEHFVMIIYVSITFE